MADFEHILLPYKQTIDEQLCFSFGGLKEEQKQTYIHYRLQ